VQIKVPALNVQNAAVTSLSVGQVGIGPITVGELIVNNVNFDLNAGVGVVHGLTVKIKLQLDLEWAIHVPLPWPFDDINIGDTTSLGTFAFNLPSVGDVTIPGLSNININIPSLTVENITAAADPVTSLAATNLLAEQITVNDLALPSAGFTLTGLNLNSLEGDDLSVPAASLRQATIGHVHSDPLKVAEFSIDTTTIGSATVPTVQSTSPFDLPANLQARRLPDDNGFDLGILKFTLIVTPSTISHIQSLEISNSNVNASTGRVVVHNVTLPFDALNLTLSQVGINTIGIPVFTAS
jgi:hypothetical protein